MGKFEFETENEKINQEKLKREQAEEIRKDEEKQRRIREENEIALRQMNEKEIRIKESDTEKSTKGCRFKSRCPYAIEQCDIEPNLEKIENEHFAACHVELN